MRPRRRGGRGWLAIALGCSATGCVGSLLESDAPAVQRYVLQPLPAAAAAVQPLPVNVLVDVRSLSPGLATERVALIRNGREFDYFAAAAWADSLGIVVEDLLLKSLLNDGRLGAVSLETPHAAAGYALLVTVLDFQAEYPSTTGLPQAHVRLRVEVADLSARQVLASVSTEARREARANSISALMSAFEQAFRSVTVELADQAVEAIARMAGD